MPSSMLDKPEARLRIVSRRPVRPTVAVRPVRPSLLDLRLRGDPWIAAHDTEQAGVYFDGCLLATCGALALDVPTLYTRLHAARHRHPRRRR